MHDIYEHYAIDTAVISQNDWKKLKSMYANVQSKYKVASGNLKQSCTHDNDFWNFFNSQLHLLYLHQFITASPGIETGVTALLPSYLSLNNNDTGPFSKEAFTPAFASGRCRIHRNESIEIISSLDNFGMLSKVAKKRI